MRNLKRALCLALASVMTLGMMVVGSSAAELKTVNDFADASEIENVQAATINTAIGIFEGMGDGNFNPSGTVTRAQMAVIVGKIRGLTEADAANLAGSSPFTDTPEWADGWISYASANKIIVGRGNNIFDPDATVTTAEAVVMLCKALGYFQNEAEFGQNWKLAAANLASSLGLYGDLRLSVDAGLSRDNVSELAFHTLTDAVPVKYNSSQDTYYTGSAWTEGVKFDYRDTLGFKNFDLMYAAKASDGETSIYGRPVDKVWGTGKLSKSNINDDGDIITSGTNAATLTKTIYTEPVAVDYSYTTDVNVKTVYDDLGSTVAAYTVDKVYDVALDTSATKTATNIGASLTASGADKDTSKFGDAELGRITEIYADDETDTLKVVYIDQYFGEISTVKTTDGKTKVTLKSVKGGATNEYETDQAFAKGDKVIYTIGKKDSGSTIATGSTIIGNIYQAQSVTGTVSAVGNNGVSVTVDGTKYDVTHYNQNDVKNKVDINDKWTFYLDNNGYVVGQEEVESSGAGSYLYVADAGKVNVDEQKASVFFADGTKKTITVVGGQGSAWTTGTKNQWAKANAVFTYTEKSDGTYNLKNLNESNTAEFDDQSATIIKGQSKLYTNTLVYYADDDTVFVDTDAKKAYTGYNNVPTFNNGSAIAVYAVFDSPKSGDTKVTVDYVFITGKVNVRSEGNEVKEYVYIVEGDAKAYETIKIGDDNYRVYTAYVDGEETTINAKVDDAVVISDHAAGLYEVERNSSGNITEATAETSSWDVTARSESSLNYTDDDNTSVVVKYTDNTVFVVIDGDEVSVGSTSSAIAKDSVSSGEDYTKVFAVEKDGTVKEIGTSAKTFDSELVFLFVNTK